MWIIGNLFGKKSTILYTIDEKSPDENRKKKDEKRRKSKDSIEYRDNLKKFFRGQL